MTGTGRSYGAITVINAIPCMIGSTIGIDLSTEAVFEVGGDKRTVNIVNAPDEDTRMAEICVSKAYARAGVEEPPGWTLTVDSEIPPSRGLKSSSSACNAILEAVFSELGTGIDRLAMVRLGTDCAREAGVTVTGAFDDAAGCDIGGIVIADNTMDKLINRSRFGYYDVILSIPDTKIRKDSLPLEALRSKGDEMRMAIGLVMHDPFGAMTMNGRIVAEAMGLDNSLAERALAKGALAAGITGTGPATAIIVPDGKGIEFAMALELDPDNTIIAGTRQP